MVDVRINNKGVTQSRNLSDSQKSVPNFGFVVFEDEKTAMACLGHRPLNLPNGHRLNVETKKKNVSKYFAKSKHIFLTLIFFFIESRRW